MDSPPRMRNEWREIAPSALTFALAVTACMGLLAAAPAGAAGRTLREVALTDYPELAGNSELLRRLASPLTVLGQERALAAAGRKLAGRPLEPATARYVVYEPATRPAAGYALLVFIPPWQDARIPPGWESVLDRFGVVFASAVDSGNEENPLGRRAPLALLAATNLRQRYAVDPQRVFIGGFSGGARVALRVALGYPDLFHGAILNAGSDALGGPQLPLPPRELFSAFQGGTHLIYLTGERDTTQGAEDLSSVKSMHQWCVAGVDEFVQPRAGHEVASPAALAQALDSLLRFPPQDSAVLAGCRAARDAQVSAQLRAAEALLAEGRTAQARKLLQKIDVSFGGLAAPRSVELFTRPSKSAAGLCDLRRKCRALAD